MADDCTDTVVLDQGKALLNGTLYHYRPYYRVGGFWVAGDSASATPAATYQGDAVDPQTLLCERLELGLAVEVARGTLAPASGAVPVLTVPHALSGQTVFPCVSVWVEENSTAERAVGEVLCDDEHLGDGGWVETEGWLSSTRLSVVGASSDPAGRIALRTAIGRVIAANLPVFAEYGLTQVTFSQKDSEDVTQSETPLYLVFGSFSCMTPSYIRNVVGEITDVETTVSSSR
ncbi:hypothetical protein [Azospirillum sp. TSO22-1]|uniref:hypothetical protein n=1 Tax=Azospirillum sp. TSO22-1 TaxID=716789 RepID=UPI000D621B9A|nr:hypothetical protein [Azospirillum sp. TSO22-1]PWC44279.1 hypothetical protein TSO221_18475 [Azospirillum sp. TSO22-1]